ncbi:NAD(P)-binding domain-containing protein [Actinomadura sp. DC4]|uniref:NADPH-dependent F420 reductase n=1 Tax=Actinomadura sp. DC4 TaxID=3055069 RepID=UPI0025B19C10|nr:NAD(P)-binding domain-containing protein [Actinomadura sp. DC4]MDN3359421.1 NAD(P)-binding domain-containing protein [Actinomadura sp. DC4]
MATLGLIGSGYIGGTLARLAVAAGLDVVLSNSRGPETLAGLASEIGARAATAEEAAAAGDWVVVTIPFKAYPQVPQAPLAGKVVLDTGNYYPQRDGQIAELDAGTATSSELVQRHLERSSVVKVFNNIYFEHLLSLARPSGAPDRTALPIAGDDAEAKASATSLLDTLGYDVFDVGPLAESWRTEPGTPVYGTPYLLDPAVPLNEDPGNPAGVDKIRDAVAAAVRG